MRVPLSNSYTVTITSMIILKSRRSSMASNALVLTSAAPVMAA